MQDNIPVLKFISQYHASETKIWNWVFQVDTYSIQSITNDDTHTKDVLKTCYYKYYRKFQKQKLSNHQIRATSAV